MRNFKLSVNSSCENAMFGSVVVIETRGVLSLVMLSTLFRPVSSSRSRYGVFGSTVSITTISGTWNVERPAVERARCSLPVSSVTRSVHLPAIGIAVELRQNLLGPEGAGKRRDAGRDADARRIVEDRVRVIGPAAAIVGREFDLRAVRRDQEDIEILDARMRDVDRDVQVHDRRRVRRRT